MSVGYEIIYDDSVDDFWGFNFEEKAIKGVNLYGVIIDGTIYKDYFDLQGPENWKCFKGAIGAYRDDWNGYENLTYFSKSFNRYEIDWNRILQLYRESFYTSTGYRWIAKPCENVIYNNKDQIDKQNRRFDEGGISKITAKQGTLTASYKKLYHYLASVDKRNADDTTDSNNDNDSLVIGVKLYAVDSAGVCYNDYFSFFDDCAIKDDKVYYNLKNYHKNLKKMEKELGVYGFVRADEDGQFEYDWDTILAAYKSAFYDCFGCRKMDKGGVNWDNEGSNGSKSIIKKYSSWHAADGVRVEGKIEY